MQAITEAGHVFSSTSFIQRAGQLGLIIGRETLSFVCEDQVSINSSMGYADKPCVTSLIPLPPAAATALWSRLKLVNERLCKG